MALPGMTSNQPSATPGAAPGARRHARRKGPPALPVLQGDPRQRAGPGQGRCLGPQGISGAHAARRTASSASAFWPVGEHGVVLGPVQAAGDVVGWPGLAGCLPGVEVAHFHLPEPVSGDQENGQVGRQG